MTPKLFEVDAAFVGQRLRDMRKKCYMTQAEAAFLIGTSDRHISAIECGRRQVKVQYIIALCAYYGFEPYRAFTNEPLTRRTKLYCIHGHARTPENVSPDGHCRTCMRVGTLKVVTSRESFGNRQCRNCPHSGAAHDRQDRLCYHDVDGAGCECPGFAKAPLTRYQRLAAVGVAA